MDSNHNSVVDYTAVAPSDTDGSKRARTPETRAYVTLMIVVLAIVFAVLLLAVLAQPAKGS